MQRFLKTLVVCTSCFLVAVGGSLLAIGVLTAVFFRLHDVVQDRTQEVQLHEIPAMVEEPSNVVVERVVRELESSVDELSESLDFKEVDTKAEAAKEILDQHDAELTRNELKEYSKRVQSAVQRAERLKYAVGAAVETWTKERADPKWSPPTSATSR